MCENVCDVTIVLPHLFFVNLGLVEGSELLGETVAPQYSNLQEMALKVQTSSEKKAGKTTKKSGKKGAEESDKVGKSNTVNYG